MRITIVMGFSSPVPAMIGRSSEIIWHRLALQFASAGHEVTLISRHAPNLARREKVDGVEHVRLRGADDRPSLLRNFFSDLRWGIRVARKLPRADVVICKT